MKAEFIRENYEPMILDVLVGVTGIMLFDDGFGSIAREEDGVLPHDISNNSIIFIDKKAKYKKNDYIVIKDSRVIESGYRITKALSSKDKDFVGRLVMSIKIYWRCKYEVENWKKLQKIQVQEIHTNPISIMRNYYSNFIGK